MCRLYGFRASAATKVECTLVHAQNALMVQSRGDSTGQGHTHGWGVSAYDQGLPRVERKAWAAYHGEAFRSTAAGLSARTVLAHVRQATVGAPALENTHPFSQGLWSLVHNGTVPNFQQVRPRLLAAMSAEHRAAIGGATDSEHLFHYLLSQRAKVPRMPLPETLRAGALQVVAWCREVDPAAAIGLNVILTDGEEMVGTRWVRSLYYVERDGVRDCEVCGFAHVARAEAGDYRAVVVASEPISQEDWLEVPEGSIYRVTADYRLSVEPF
jgi:glutamine amidotransferase